MNIGGFLDEKSKNVIKINNLSMKLVQNIGKRVILRILTPQSTLSTTIIPSKFISRNKILLQTQFHSI